MGGAKGYLLRFNKIQEKTKLGASLGGLGVCNCILNCRFSVQIRSLPWK